MEAHSKVDEQLGGLGEASEAANRPRRSPDRCGDEGGRDDAAVHPASRELVETKRKARRFFWKHRRGEGLTLAAVELVGALGCSWSIVREREQRG